MKSSTDDFVLFGPGTRLPFARPPEILIPEPKPGNRLAPVIARPLENSKMGGAFLSLCKLVLNATGVKFSDLEYMKGCFPNLTDLHLASCKISTIDCGGGGAAFEGWPSLELIDLSDNQ